MKRLVSLVLAAILCLACMSIASGEKEIAANNGLVLLSPASFFDGKYKFVNARDNTYEYTHSAWITYSFLLDGAAEMDEVKADAECYLQALADSGYFKRSAENTKCLVYIGSPTVATATIRGKDQGWHVSINTESGFAALDFPPSILVNMVKDFSFSDITVVWGEETDTEESDVTGKSCSYCDGDGKCNECGGTSWVWVTEFVFNDDGFPVLETNNKFCGAIYCNGGSCSKCGGDGVR